MLYLPWLGLWLLVVNDIFNNISVISWRLVLLMGETGVPGKNHQPAASHWQTLLHNVVKSHISPWLTTTCSALHTMIHNHLLNIVHHDSQPLVRHSTIIHNQWLSITHHDSQPFAQYNTNWFRTTGSALYTMIHNHWLSIAHYDSYPPAQHNTTTLATTGSA
jgi:hypothetical protein